MKPFNLEEYLANPNKKVITRDGRKVTRIICTDAKGEYPIVALIEQPNSNDEVPFTFTIDGKYFSSEINKKDLFFASENHEGWVNLYITDTNVQIATHILYDSKEKAIEASKRLGNNIETAKIEW